MISSGVMSFLWIAVGIVSLTALLTHSAHLCHKFREGQSFSKADFPLLAAWTYALSDAGQRAFYLLLRSDESLAYLRDHWSAALLIGLTIPAAGFMLANYPIRTIVRKFAASCLIATLIYIWLTR